MLKFDAECKLNPALLIFWAGQSLRSEACVGIKEADFQWKTSLIYLKKITNLIKHD